MMRRKARSTYNCTATNSREATILTTVIANIEEISAKSFSIISIPSINATSFSNHDKACVRHIKANVGAQAI